MLVIEDNFLIGNKIVNKIFEVSNLKEVHLKASLEDAISFLKNNIVGLISLDLSLPDGNGIELLKWLQEEKIETEVFIFSTSTELEKICLRYGASAFFDKSKDFDELINAIKNVKEKSVAL